MKMLITGLISLIVCCVFYLLWWRAGFYPGVTVSRVTGRVGALLYITAVFGFLGVFLTVGGVNGIHAERQALSWTAVLLGGVIVYAVLLAGSALVLHRQVTTELALITGWAALMVMAAARTYAAGALTQGAFTAMLVIIAIAGVLSLIFYLAYYNVEPMKGFIFGMIPLITEAVSMLVFVVMLFVYGKGA